MRRAVIREPSERARQRGDAAAFLKEFPVPFPHFYDNDAGIARVFGGGRAWPTTAFYCSTA